MAMNFVAPGMTDDQYDESKRLDVFQSRTAEWILAFAIRLSKEKDGGIASLIVSTSIIEPMGGIRSRSSTVESRFKSGFEYLFPDVSKVAKDVYSRLRGGLFHEGFIKPGLVITNLSSAIEVKGGFVYVDPERFAIAVNEGFERFCGDIRADKTLRKNFDIYWEKQAEDNVKPLLNLTLPQHGTPVTLSTSAAMSPFDLGSTGGNFKPK